MVRSGRGTTPRAGIKDSQRPYLQDFAAVYETLYPRVLRYFEGHSPAGQDPRDLAAETFAVALRGRARFRGHTPAEGENWIWAIAHAQLKMALRRRRIELAANARLSRQDTAVTEDETPRIDDVLDARASSRTLADALGELSREERTIIQMHVLEERPYPEIAQAFAVRDETARARGSRAVRKLAKSLHSDQAPSPRPSPSPPRT